jgi:hypothetical protein
MPISVLCPGCQARFSVSEKFAGKKGPCPKCKQIITVPEVPKDEVKIHVPEEFASGGKSAQGRPVLKPIARKETKLKAGTIAAIAGSALAVFVLAYLLRGVSDTVKGVLIFAGLMFVAPALVIAGYTFLRNDEIEPYRGQSLWARAGLCAVVYAALWGVYAILNGYGLIGGETYYWFFIGPIFIAAGAAASFATLDLDFGSAAMHYCFFLLVTLLLRAALGLPAVWNTSTLSNPFA